MVHERERAYQLFVNKTQFRFAVDRFCDLFLPVDLRHLISLDFEQYHQSDDDSGTARVLCMEPTPASLKEEYPEIGDFFLYTSPDYSKFSYSVITLSDLFISGIFPIAGVRRNND